MSPIEKVVNDFLRLAYNQLITNPPYLGDQLEEFKRKEEEAEARSPSHQTQSVNGADKVIRDEIKDRLKDVSRVDESANPLMNRQEDKYFIPSGNLSKLISGIKEKLVEGDIDTFVRYNENQTIYLDNRDLDSFKDNLERITPRFKVRIRRYNPNGEGWEDVAYVELKIKEESGFSDKVRIRVPDSIVSSVCKGKEIKTNDELIKLNRDISKQELWKRVVAINSIISKYGFKKQVVVEYNRRAFSNSKIRITVDDSLRYYDFSPIEADLAASIKESDQWQEIQKPINKLHNNDKLILEVKYEESIPSSIKDLLEECEAKEVKFSKYCAAVVTYLTSDKSKAPIQRQKIKMDTQKIIDGLKSKEASMGKIYFLEPSTHFIRRMEERKITEAKVKEVLRDGESHFENAQKGIMIFIKDGIKVVANIAEKLLITVMWLKEKEACLYDTISEIENFCLNASISPEDIKKKEKAQGVLRQDFDNFMKNPDDYSAQKLAGSIISLKKESLYGIY